MATIPTNQGNPQATDVAVESALPMVGSSVREDLQATLGLADAQVAKLFEDRNIMLADGGDVTFPTLGTSVSFTQSLKLHINSKVAGGAPTVIDLGAATRTLSANLRMIYAVINRTAGTAVVTDDAVTLLPVVAANQEIVLIAKRIDSADGTKTLYFRNGSALNAGGTGRVSGGGGANTFLSNLTSPTAVSQDLLPSSPYTAIIPFTGGNGAPYDLNDHSDYAVSYVPASTIAAAKIGFDIWNSNGSAGVGEPGSVTGKIYDSNGPGGKPGTLLATGTTVLATAINATSSSSLSEVSFLFSPAVTLTSGHTYYLAFSETGIGNNAYSVGSGPVSGPGFGILYHDSPGWSGPDSNIRYSVYTANLKVLGNTLNPWSAATIGAVHGLSAPALGTDAANKDYVDAAVGAVSSSLTIKDANFTITDDVDVSKQAKFEASSITTGTTRTYTFPDASTTLVGHNNTQTLSNKTLDNTTVLTVKDSNLTIQDNADVTKQVKFEASGVTTGTTRTLTVPDASTTIVGTDTTQYLTNKQIAFSTANNAVATGANADLTLPTTGIVRLTNGALTSIGGIAAGSSGQEVIVVNATGASVNLLNNGAGGNTTGDATLFAYEGTESSALSSTISNTTDRVGQSWTASASGQIDSVRLSIGSTTAAPAGTFKVDIYLANGSGLPTGSVLGSSNNVNASNAILGVQSNRVTFPFSTPVTGIVSGTQYVLVLNTTSTTFAGGAVIKFYGRTAAILPYSGGTLVSGPNDTPPTSWTTTPSSDLWFEVLSTTGDGIIAHNPSYAGGQLSSTGGANWLGQVFTALSTSSVTKAFVALTGTGSGTVTARLRATSGGLPTGGDLGVSASNPLSGLLAAPNTQLYEFDFSTPVAVTSGVKYALILDTSAFSSSLEWAQAGGNGSGGSEYSSGGNGDAVSSPNSGGSWSTIGSQPTVFAQFFIISADTGTVPSSDLLFTGTNATQALPNTAAAQFSYDSTSAKWRMVGISGTSAVGTVTSVALTTPAFLSVAGSPVTTSGTLAVTLSGTALPETSGGTGKNTYTTGDTLYSNASNSLAKLPIGSTGQVLTVAAGIPSWATTATTSASGAAGSVQFAGAGGAFSSDNANLFFDDTNNRLGVGTNAPSYPLDVRPATSRNRIGNMQLGAWPSDTTICFFGNDALDQTAVGKYAMLQKADGNTFFNAATGGKIRFQINDVEKMEIDASGNVGIGATSLVDPFTVNIPTGGRAAQFDSSTSGDNYITSRAGTARTVLGVNRNNFGFIGTETTHPLNIRTDNTARITISSAGAVQFNTGYGAGVITSDASGNLTSVAAAGTSLSSLTAATTSNSINNAANQQTWSWDSLAGGNGLILSSSAAFSGNIHAITASNASNTGRLLNMSNATAGGSGFGIVLSMSGATGANTALSASTASTSSNVRNVETILSAAAATGTNLYAAHSGTSGFAIESTMTNTSNTGSTVKVTNASTTNGAKGVEVVMSGATANVRGVTVSNASSDGSARGMFVDMTAAAGAGFGVQIQNAGTGNSQGLNINMNGASGANSCISANNSSVSSNVTNLDFGLNAATAAGTNARFNHGGTGGINVEMVSSGSTGSKNILRLKNSGTQTANNGAILLFNNQANGGSADVAAIEGQVTDVSSTFKGSLLFKTATAGGATTERMRLNDLGYLGLGTSSPNFLVDFGNFTPGTTPNTINDKYAIAMGFNAGSATPRVASIGIAGPNPNFSHPAYGAGTNAQAQRINVNDTSLCFSTLNTSGDGQIDMYTFNSAGNTRSRISIATDGTTYFDKYNTNGIALFTAASWAGSTYGQMSTLAPGTTGNVLTSNGTNWVSQANTQFKKNLFVLTATDITTNGYVDLTNVAKLDSISFNIKGGNVQVEGASYDYTVSYTGGAGGNTRITFTASLISVLVPGNVIILQYAY